MSRRVGTCVLCGVQTNELQKEDIFPTWARNLLKKELAESPANGQWPEKVVLPACEACNGGLGGEFEDPAAPVLKPLARGDSKTLDQNQMRIVAAWARLKDIEYILGRPYMLTDEGQVPFSESNFAYWRGQLAIFALLGSRRAATFCDWLFSAPLTRRAPIGAFSPTAGVGSTRK